MTQQQQTQSVSTTRRDVRSGKCKQCGSTMELAMFEPAEMYGSKVDAYIFRCACGASIRENVAR